MRKLKKMYQPEDGEVYYAAGFRFYFNLITALWIVSFLNMANQDHALVRSQDAYVKDLLSVDKINFSLHQHKIVYAAAGTVQGEKERVVLGKVRRKNSRSEVNTPEKYNKLVGTDMEVWFNGSLSPKRAFSKGFLVLLEAFRPRLKRVMLYDEAVFERAKESSKVKLIAGLIPFVLALILGFRYREQGKLVAFGFTKKWY